MFNLIRIGTLGREVEQYNCIPALLTSYLPRRLGNRNFGREAITSLRQLTASQRHSHSYYTAYTRHSFDLYYVAHKIGNVTASIPPSALIRM